MNRIKNIKEKLIGPAFAIITPFNQSDNKIDYKCLTRYIDHLYKGGAKIFYVMAYNSRFSVLTDQEIFELNDFVIKKVLSYNDEKTVSIAADPLHCSTQTTIKAAKLAEQSGGDCISLIFREKVYFEDQVYNHFLEVAKNSNIGILIHEMPLNNGIPGEPSLINWPLNLLDKICNIENVIALKEDAKEKKYTKEVCDLLSDRVSIITSGTGMRQWIENAPACSAYLSGIGGIVPEVEIDFYNAFVKNDMQTCDNIINNIEIPFDQIKKFGWHIGFKSALEVAGLMSKYERMPLQAVSDDDHLEVKKILLKIASQNPKYFKDEF